MAPITMPLTPREPRLVASELEARWNRALVRKWNEVTVPIPTRPDQRPSPTKCK